MRVIRGVLVVVAVLIAASCGREAPPPPDAPGTVEVTNAEFVLNPDGSATLSANVVNGTEFSYELSYVPTATPFGDTFGSIPVRYFNPRSIFPPRKSTTLGDVADQIQIRLAPAPPLGDRVTLDMGFWPTEGEDPVAEEQSVTVEVPVVARTIDHNAVLGVEPNTKITIEDGKIFVIPGQSRALIDGSVISSITDNAYDLPTANDEQGNLVEYRHNTATGGPYGIHAEKGKTVRISSPPYTVPNGEVVGDFDYFDAKDLTIAEKITVNFPFQSGDVIGSFTVVRG
ncbi:hypothetical protein [Aeromicrobium sp.]|uniref:hypothetical protein n=1 Tax=Aeromicrobium sp. TaxID=1871063 RepID=UPI002FC65B45